MIKSNRLKNKLNIFSLLASIIIIIFNCQHARIRIAPPLPPECKPFTEKEGSDDCIKKREEWQEALNKIPTTVKEYEQVYYYWGLSPSDFDYDLKNECPKGTYEIHQFSTLKQGVYEQVTLGFYSPRTLRLTCLNQEFTPEPQNRPTGRRR
ncbi:MAG: hypothetical protein JJT78_09485 [Leptospira sp.]|nr:hypothetical protein [Leptospira sp.]